MCNGNPPSGFDMYFFSRLHLSFVLQMCSTTGFSAGVFIHVFLLVSACARVLSSFHFL